MDSSSSSAADESKLFVYVPLKDNEIRLVSIEKSSHGDDRIICKLQHFPLQNAKFIALSYVWGDPKADAQITVNDSNFEVNRSLHNSLIFLEKGASMELRWYWIDAICINQADVVEKSKQVSRMTNIYSSAFFVVCHLGNERVGYVEDISNLSLAIWKARTRQTDIAHDDNLIQIALRETIGKLSEKPLDRDFLSILAQLYQVTDSAWFRRIWTFQEFIVSSTAFAVKSNLPIALPALGDIMGELLQSPMSPLHRMLFWAHFWFYFKIIGPATGMQKTFQNSEWRSQSFANQVRVLLEATASMDATLPHDQIYGVLGMTNVDEIPEHLQPDYTLPFNRVYHDYTRYVIENTGDIRIIELGIDRLESFPGWVPDFRRKNLLRRPSFGARQATNSPTFSADGSKLTVQGTEMGRMLSYYAKDTNSSLRQGLIHIQDTILKLSAVVRGMELKNVFMEWLQVRLQYPAEYMSHTSVEEFLDMWPDPDNAEVWGQTVGTAFQQLMSSISMLKNTDYCVLETGDIAWCAVNDLPTANDRVYALKGSDCLAILRPEGSSEDTFEYIGYCTNSNTVMNLDEEFFSRRIVDYITLV